jgi:hypothetical protein
LNNSDAAFRYPSDPANPQWGALDFGDFGDDVHYTSTDGAVAWLERLRRLRVFLRNECKRTRIPTEMASLILRVGRLADQLLSDALEAALRDPAANSLQGA